MFETTYISNRRFRLANLLRAGGIFCFLYVAYWIFLQYQTEFEYTQRLEEEPVVVPKSPTAPAKPKQRPPLARGEFIGKVEFFGNASVVLEGVDDRTLKVAVGHVPGTALPGEVGRIAFAAHRDTFFRGLRDVKVGNRISVSTRKGKFEYRVTETEIVKPDAMHVLSPTKVDTLTLITCYPFNFIGHAPLRFIVHATRVSPRV